MMFATIIFCDKCDRGIQFPSIVPKYFIVKRARENGWSIGKRHLCSECRDGNRRVGLNE